jgi:hypothetical protein
MSAGAQGEAAYSSRPPRCIATTPYFRHESRDRDAASLRGPRGNSIAKGPGGRFAACGQDRSSWPKPFDIDYTSSDADRRAEWVVLVSAVRPWIPREL